MPPACSGRIGFVGLSICSQVRQAGWSHEVTPFPSGHLLEKSDWIPGAQEAESRAAPWLLLVSGEYGLGLAHGAARVHTIKA